MRSRDSASPCIRGEGGVRPEPSEIDAAVARAEAEEAARRKAQEAFDRDRRDLERQRAEIMQTDNLIVALREKIDGRKQYAGIARAIDAYLDKRADKVAA